MKVFGFAAWSGSGKTSLLERLVPLFVARGLRVSVVKHAHHDFDVDQPGKDSYRHRQAGATEVLVCSDARWAVMHELRGGPEPGLDWLLGRLSDCDLVLVEGYKREPIPKLEVHRRGVSGGWLHPADPYIVAIASDEAPPDRDLPNFALDEHAAIADFICGHLGLGNRLQGTGKSGIIGP